MENTYFKKLNIQNALCIEVGELIRYLDLNDSNVNVF